jgi:hypothetical protein
VASGFARALIEEKKAIAGGRLEESLSCGFFRAQKPFPLILVANFFIFIHPMSLIAKSSFLSVASPWDVQYGL